MNFANTWSVLFCVLSAIPLFCQSRRLVQEEVVNGAYKLHTHCLAQFVVTLPLNFLAVLVYEAVLHWMVGFNDWFPSYIYAVLLAWAVLQCFDGVLLCVVESLKHPMLVASFSMVALGVFALFAGFFIPQEDLAPAVRWIPYIVASCELRHGRGGGGRAIVCVVISLLLRPCRPFSPLLSATGPCTPAAGTCCCASLPCCVLTRNCFLRLQSTPCAAASSTPSTDSASTWATGKPLTARS